MEKLKKQFFKVCIFLFAVVLETANVSANDRNFVISKINEEYFLEDKTDIIENINSIDKTLPDDTYLKKIFAYLDKYSEIYTKDEYNQRVIYDNGQMISASLTKSEIIVKIDHFGNGVENIFSNYLTLCKDSGIKKLTLDLRDCPGGYISVMTDIACQILPKGKILTAIFNNSEKTYYSELKKCPFDEITVLISSNTASAAEILAADLQEAGVAVLEGTNSYGKTSIQSYYRLENGGAFKLTCGKYLTRNDVDITGVGIAPDTVKFDYPVRVRWNSNCNYILDTKKMKVVNL